MPCVTFTSRVQLYLKVVPSLARQDLSTLKQPNDSTPLPLVQMVCSRSPSSGKSTDGELDGDEVGDAEGLLVGEIEGDELGVDVGLADGAGVGATDGESVGFGVGLADGDVVGAALGLDVGASTHWSVAVSQKPEQQAPGSLAVQDPLFEIHVCSDSPQTSRLSYPQPEFLVHLAFISSYVQSLPPLNDSQ